MSLLLMDLISVMSLLLMDPISDDPGKPGHKASTGSDSLAGSVTEGPSPAPHVAPL